MNGMEEWEGPNSWDTPVSKQFPLFPLPSTHLTKSLHTTQLLIQSFNSPE